MRFFLVRVKEAKWLLAVSYLKTTRENKTHTFFKTSPRNGGIKVFLPIRGTESEVAGMISATSNINTVRDSSTVMPEGDKHADTSAETQRIPSFITV